LLSRLRFFVVNWFAEAVWGPGSEFSAFNHGGTPEFAAVSTVAQHHNEISNTALDRARFFPPNIVFSFVLKTAVVRCLCALWPSPA
jgi:hypothetical protein